MKSCPTRVNATPTISRDKKRNRSRLVSQHLEISSVIGHF